MKEEKQTNDNEYLAMLEEAIVKLDEKIHRVVRGTEIANESHINQLETILPLIQTPIVV